MADSSRRPTPAPTRTAVTRTAATRTAATPAAATTTVPPTTVPPTAAARAPWRLPVPLGTTLAATVVLVVVAVLALGAQAALIPAVALAVVGPRLTAIDVVQHRLPNPLVIPALLAGVVGLGVGWFVTGDPPLVPVVAGLIGGGALFVLALFGGIGMGDAKLAAALGFASPSVAIAMLSPLLAFTLGGAGAIVVMIRRGRHAHLAFGPFLLAGYFGALAIVAVTRIGR